MKRRLCTLPVAYACFGGTIIFCTPTLSASELHSAQSNSTWASSAHLGFAVEDNSSTGFHRHGGSVLILDATKLTNSTWHFGLRTVAAGATGSGGRLYRLATGPMVSIKITDNWSLEGMLGLFRESGLDNDLSKAYNSRGTMTMLAWRRYFSLLPKIRFSWGGYIEGHWGSIALEPAATSGIVSRYADVARNIGSSHAVAVALATEL